MIEYFSSKENLTIEEYKSSMKKFNEEYYYNIIFELLLYNNKLDQLKNDTKNIITNLIKYLENKNKEIYHNCLNDYVQSKTSPLINNLLDIQTEVNNEKGGYLTNYKSRNELKEEVNSFIKNEIIDKSKDVIISNYLKLIPFQMIDLLQNFIINEFDYILSKNSTKNILNEKIKSQFKKLTFQERFTLFKGELILIIILIIAFIYKFHK